LHANSKREEKTELNEKLGTRWTDRSALEIWNHWPAPLGYGQMSPILCLLKSWFSQLLWNDGTCSMLFVFKEIPVITQAWVTLQFEKHSLGVTENCICDSTILALWVFLKVVSLLYVAIGNTFAKKSSIFPAFYYFFPCSSELETEHSFSRDRWQAGVGIHTSSS
jgi:hypothetical protein